MFDDSLLGYDHSIDELFNHMTTKILSAATQSIPISTDTKGRPPVPWFDEEIREELRKRRRLMNKLNRGAVIGDNTLVEFKRQRAVVRRMVREKK